MLTQEMAIEQAKSFVSECQQSGITLEKAILFGSAAKNQLREYSDIDIALVSSIFTENFLTNNHLTSEINIRYPIIEVHHFNSRYFHEGDPFIEEITETGIELI